MRELGKSKIYFNKNVYKPGDILTGHIEVNFNSPKEAKSLCIKILGKARVYWTESENTTNSDGNSTSTTVSYSNEEIYFKEKFYAVGGVNSSIKTQISAGQHEYPFKFLLPFNLPSSYEDSTGKIIYSVKVTLDRPWKISKFFEMPFIVEGSFDIHLKPQLKEPNILTMEKQFGLIFKSNPLKAIIKAPHSLFAPGQTIPLKVEVINDSDTAVNKISIKLRQILKYYATTKTNKTWKTLSKNHIECAIRSKNSLLMDHSLKVPDDVILYDLSGCKIIDCDYVIEVILNTSGLTKNLSGEMLLFPLK